MKCPSCRTKIGSEDYKNDPWSDAAKTGRGFYLCPGCGKRLVRRFSISPLAILPLFLAGVLAGTLIYATAFLLNSALGLGEAASFFLGVAGVGWLIVVLWLYPFQPVDITTE